MAQLAEQYEAGAISAEKMAYVLEQISGSRHVNVLYAMVSNWELYNSAMAEYAQGAGTMYREAELAAESWEGQLARLRNSFTLLIASLTHAGGIATTVLGGLSSIISGLAVVLGHPVGQVAALTVAFAALGKAIAVKNFLGLKTVLSGLGGRKIPRRRCCHGYSSNESVRSRWLMHDRRLRRDSNKQTVATICWESLKAA